MSELTEVGKAFAGWAEENSGLAVDENFEYTDRTVGNFAAAAFAAGAQWQTQREPTDAEIEAMARLEAQEENEDGFGEPWDCMVEEDQEAFRANAKRMLLAARKAVAE